MIVKTLVGVLTLVLLNWICPAFVNSVDPDQLASEDISPVLVLVYLPAFSIGLLLKKGICSLGAI